jgi:hypothetical protein
MKTYIILLLFLLLIFYFGGALAEASLLISNWDAEYRKVLFSIFIAISLFCCGVNFMVKNGFDKYEK